MNGFPSAGVLINLVKSFKNPGNGTRNDPDGAEPLKSFEWPLAPNLDLTAFVRDLGIISFPKPSARTLALAYSTESFPKLRCA
jgi:hypothetical protein